MPDNEPYQNSSHLVPRMGVDIASHPPEIGVDEHASAIAIEGHIRDGDTGAVRRLLHAAEHRTSPFKPDPWKLIAHLADRQVSRQQEAAGEHPVRARG